MDNLPTFLDLFRECRRPTSKHDTYFAAYDELFARYRDKDITFVEVGISGGGSLEVWKRYFGKNARVIGIDLNPALRDVLNREGFEVFVGDQADPAFWRSFYADVGKIDVLLDDGGHTNAQQWCTLTQSLDHINDGGLLVIEDVHASYMTRFGNPSRSSFISRAKQCVDELNYRSSSIDDRDQRMRRRELARDVDVSRVVHSMQFFESIVALSIDSTKCRRSHEIHFGSSEHLPGGIQPEDFRFRGVRDSISVRLRRRMLRALRRFM